MSRRHWQIQISVVLTYVLLALVLTWPLVIRFSTFVPGNGVDDPPLTWNLWWLRYAMLEQGSNPFASDHIFYPLGINLATYTLTILNGLLSIPLQGVVGLVSASNFLLLSSFVLSGYGAFLLAYEVLRSIDRRQALSQQLGPIYLYLPAFGAGLLYAFASSKLAYAALGQWNIASSQWVPFFVLYLLKMGRFPFRWRYPLMAALFLLFQAYAELTYATFLVLFAGLWLLWQMAATLRVQVDPSEGSARWLRQPAIRSVFNLTLIGALFLVGLVPVLVMMLPDLLAEGGILAEGVGFADVFSADLLGFLVPTTYHPFLGSLVNRFNFDHEVGQHIYLGYSVLALATLGTGYWWRRTRVSSESMSPPAEGRKPLFGPKFWALSTFVFWLLTLGPALRINGHDTGLPLPFALVAQLPFFEGNRYPSRYSVMLFLCLAMLVALGLAAILRLIRKRSLTVSFVLFLILVYALLFEHLSIPLPLTDMAVPPVYETLARELPEDATLLDLPVAWRNGFRVTGTQHPTIMFQQYYQSVHGRRILAGNTSRNPALKFQYFTEAPVINTIIALETGHQVDPNVYQSDRELAADVLRFLNVQAILIRPAQTGPDMASYVEDVMPVDAWLTQDGILAYKVNLPPWPETWTITPGDALSRLGYAEGWGLPADGSIWAQRRDVRLLAPMNGQAQTLSFRAYTPEPGQQLQVAVNGETVSWIGMAAGWLDYEVELPAGLVQPGLNKVRLLFETLFPPEAANLSPRSIGQTGVEAPANIVVHSADLEVGNFGHVYVNGVDESPNRRGYNVVVLDPASGAVEGSMAFDVHMDPEASGALAEYLAGIRPGAIVAVAAADEASRLLGQDAVDALQAIGAVGDLREKFRWGHAILGVKGAAPGTALETMAWMRPVAVIAGDGVTEPGLTAAFETIIIQARPGQ